MYQCIYISFYPYAYRPPHPHTHIYIYICIEMYLYLYVHIHISTSKSVPWLTMTNPGRLRRRRRRHGRRRCHRHRRPPSWRRCRTCPEPSGIDIGADVSRYMDRKICRYVGFLLTNKRLYQHRPQTVWAEIHGVNSCKLCFCRIAHCAISC